MSRWTDEVFGDASPSARERRRVQLEESKELADEQFVCNVRMTLDPVRNADMIRVCDMALGLV